MGKNCLILLLVLAFLVSGCSSASSAPAAAKIVGGIVTNVASAAFKWLWSLKSTSKTAISSRSMMKFESGYSVETVFDGSKHGIEPYSVEMSPSGELLVLDSENSNIYKISTTPLSRYSRPKLVTGSPEGYSGHVDGRAREARLNHPKGLTMDERGNVYVADTMNMAIRKISDTGVVTIAGGKRNRGGGHVDGPSEDAKFSDDFDIVYVGSSCSLLVVDRGNQAIREIQLHDDDCSSYEYDGNLHLGGAVLVAACFFGYMLALLQRRISSMFSSDNYMQDSRTHDKGMPPAPYQKAHKSMRPPLIPPEDEYEKPEEGLFGSLGRLFAHTGSSVVEIFGGLFSGRKKQQQQQHLYQHHMRQHYHPHPHHHPKHANSSWPVQESFVIPDEDEPPPPAVDSRDPTPRKSYPFTTKELERSRHYNTNRQNHPFYGGAGWNGEVHKQHHHHHQQQQQYHQKHQSSRPQTYYEQSCETNEIVFGAVQVQEQDGRREAMVIKAVDYGDPIYNNHNIRSRYNYMGYSYGYN